MVLILHVASEMKAIAGGVLIIALTVVGLWLKMRRRRRLAAGLGSLSGKVVVITGASSGLGEGTGCLEWLLVLVSHPQSCLKLSTCINLSALVYWVECLLMLWNTSNSAQVVSAFV